MKHVAHWLRLVHRMGPWSDPRKPPAGCRRSLVQTDGNLWVRFVEPAGNREPRGAMLVLHGVHYLGPDEERLDRFLHVLAEFGYLVAAPYLPDYLSLVPKPEVERDAEAGLDALLGHPSCPKGIKPGVFSISFGSYPALRLAAGARQNELGAVLCFGGYADFEACMRFSVFGAEGRQRDQRSHPVVYLNLMDHVEGAPTDPAERKRLWSAIMRLIRWTWELVEDPTEEQYLAAAERVAYDLEGPLRTALMDAAGVSAAGANRLGRAIDAGAGSLAFLDPRDKRLKHTSVPVTIVHGHDDTVIPVEEAAKLKAACAQGTQVHLTGLYGHSDVQGLGSVSESVKEMRVLFRVLRAMGQAGLQSR